MFIDTKMYQNPIIRYIIGPPLQCDASAVAWIDLSKSHNYSGIQENKRFAEFH
jgi:hypothetical protein